MGFSYALRLARHRLKSTQELTVTSLSLQPYSCTVKVKTQSQETFELQFAVTT